MLNNQEVQWKLHPQRQLFSFTWCYTSLTTNFDFFLPLAYLNTNNKMYDVFFLFPRPPDIPEILWFEEENDLIKSCAALSSALGLQKSFSTSDISNLPSPVEETPLNPPLRGAVSDLALSSLQR